MFIFLVIPISIASLFIFLFFHNLDEMTCEDNGICKQGLEIGIKDEMVKVTKENCIKYNFLWNEKDKTCNLNKPSKQ